MRKPILNILLVTFISLAFAGCTWKLFPNKKTSPTDGKNSIIQKEKTPSEKEDVYPDKIEEDLLVFESTISDQSALDLLKDNAEVEYDEFDFGVMVKSINGKAGDNKHYWALYVNGEYATQGADQTILAVDDVLEWRFEEIKAE